MTENKKYMPSSNNDFIIFEGEIVDVIVPNAVTWNIPAAQVATLQTWSVGYAPLFNAIKNTANRTHMQIVAHNVYRKQYEAFLRTFIQSFVVNNILIPVDQRVGMGLNPRGYNPRSKRPKIETVPVISLRPLGGGLMRFSFRVIDTDGRSKIHPDSDGVEIYFEILTSEADMSEAPVTEVNKKAVSILGTSQTESGFDTHFSTRAIFRKQLSIDDKGKTLYIYARWVNNTNPELSGNFSAVTSAVIS
jgi:hypothetical protein